MTTSRYLTLLSDLLATEDVVCIPGFGGFLTKYRPAEVDPINGTIDPPTKYIAFNAALKDDGGKLQEFYDNLAEIDTQEFRMTRFVEQLRTELNSHQVVVIPKIGRLYKDYEGQMHFMPDLDNLNNQSFGLPRLKFTPRLRLKTDAELMRPHVASTSSTNGGRSTLKRVVQAAAVCALVVSSIYLINHQSQSTGDIKMSAIDTVIDSPLVLETETSNSEHIVEIKEAASETDTDVVKSNISIKESIIMIGAFGNPDNVDRLLTRIEQLGYEPHVDNRGALQRVGITVRYGDQAALSAYLSDIKAQFTEKAWVLE